MDKGEYSIGKYIRGGGIWLRNKFSFVGCNFVVFTMHN